MPVSRVRRLFRQAIRVERFRERQHARHQALVRALRHLANLSRQDEKREASRSAALRLRWFRAILMTASARAGAKPTIRAASEKLATASSSAPDSLTSGAASVAADPPAPGSLHNRFVPSFPAPAQSSADSDAEAAYWERWGAAEDGARIVATRAQKSALAFSFMVSAILLYMRPATILTSWIAIITAAYLVTGAYKIWLLVRGESANADALAHARQATGDDLPVYTVLVPLHREGRILPTLVERLKSIDYPPDRLQILLLIEMDDEETLEAAKRRPLPDHISAMVMPPGQPRTKPRALNVGLHAARGEYIVIFDAEDRPERDQLRKAVAAFRSLPHNVVCVQGRLNFYNRHQSLLTRLFAVDYAVWYDQLLPGLAFSGRRRSGAFIPLGGTSNHFRVEVLRQVGGWDPFNVTEDCDLGARLGRAGLRVAMLDSTTWEEAVPRIRPWIRQRSRWVKGYLQTYLVHMRHPLRLLGQLGLRGFVDFQMLVGASCLVVLLNPLMWALTAVYVVGRGTPVDSFIETLFPAPLYYAALLSFVIGNFIFYYCNTYVCVRHDHISLTRYALLTPIYWLFMSFGAWAGLISLIRNPYYWAKTEHGVSLSHVESSVAIEGFAQAG